jgi:hypothetical protein
MVEYVVGAGGGQTIIKIMEETTTCIHTAKTDDGKPFFVVQGNLKEQYLAKLMIKETVVRIAQCNATILMFIYFVIKVCIS